MAMKLSTGKVAFPIEFDNGDKDCIYFNPNDPDLATRLVNAKNNIAERMEQIKTDEILLNNEGNIEVNTISEFLKLEESKKTEIISKAEAAAEIVNKTKNIVFEELDRAFGSSISKVVFKHCSPFAIVNGDYFFVQFIEAIKPEIESQIKKSSEETKSKIEKHIGKYRK